MILFAAWMGSAGCLMWAWFGDQILTYYRP